MIAQIAAAPSAQACGCFTPPGPSTPVVQAGERILFRIDDGMVTAHVQIAFSGKAEEFGWLLPLPSVPTLEVGVEAMFAELESKTAPSFQRFFTSRWDDCPIRSYNGGGGSSGAFGCGNAAVIDDPAGKGCRTDAECGSRAICVQGICVVDLRDDMSSPRPPDFADPVAVASDSVGPYDYAVLKADDSRAMLEWLQKNRYYVPSTSDAELKPYIHPGAYFLALKLRSGKAVGDLQPIVVRYASDQPMIPLILTSVGAVPDMSVEAFVLGSARAVPRNYYHAVLDEAALWMAPYDYNAVFREAVHAAPKRHAFVTEYAGPSDLMRGWIARPSVRATELGGLGRPGDFVRYLGAHGLADARIQPQLAAILRAHVKEPEALVTMGVTEAAFLGALPYWNDVYSRNFPDEPPIEFDAAAATVDVMARLVEPITASLALFEGRPWLTRLRTVLSPEDMTDDPVFGFNPELPAVSQLHQATFERACLQSSVLVREPGASGGEGPEQRFDQNTQGLPAAARIERLLEEGPAEAVVDNAPLVRGRQVTKTTRGDAEGSAQGCAVGPGAAHRGELLEAALLLGVAAVLRGARRRRRR